MTTKTEEALGLQWGASLGETPWNVWMDSNLVKIGATAQISVIDRTTTAPPGSFVEGNRYIVGTGATGAWSAKDGQLAVAVDGSYQFYALKKGWVVEDQSDGYLYKWNGTSFDKQAKYSDVTAAISAHNAAADPHAQYVLESTIGAANGVAPLDAGSQVPAAHLANYSTTAEVAAALAGKQATLVSGDNIKTVGGQSLLGSGNISIGSLYFAESRSTAAPNATVPAHQFTPSGAEIDIDAVLAPKGTGALLVAVPDATSAGGDKRGNYAVDLQMSRTLATQVVAASYSVILGGRNNTNTQDFAVIVGGGDNSVNTALSGYAVLAGGYTNNNSSAYASMLGGHTNSIAASSNYCTLVGGSLNDVSGEYSFLGGGTDNTLTGSYGFLGGGASCSIGGIAGVICGGASNSIIHSGSQYCVIVGGASNTITSTGAGGSGPSNSQYSFIGGGQNNSMGHNTTHSVIVGGLNNDIDGHAAGVNYLAAYNTIVGGTDNQMPGAYTGRFIGGGADNQVTGYYSFIAGGASASTRTLFGSSARACGQFAARGDAQQISMVLRKQTTDATPTNLNALAGTDARGYFILEETSAATLTVKIVGNEPATGDTVHYIIKCAASRPGGVGTTTIVGTPDIYSAEAASLAGCSATVVADTTNGILQVEVTGEAGKTINWVAYLDAVETFG